MVYKVLGQFSNSNEICFMWSLIRSSTSGACFSRVFKTLETRRDVNKGLKASTEIQEVILNTHAGD